MSYCTTTIAKAITLDCENPSAGGVESTGYIINRNDIDFANCTTEGNMITQLALKSDKKAYKIDQPAKNPFTGTTTNMEEGTYHNTFTHQVNCVVLENTPDCSENIIDPLANGSFVVILENVAKNIGAATGQEFQVFGWHQGLKATALDNEKYSEDTEGGWAVSLQETKSPVSAMFLFKQSYAATKTLIDSLIAG